MARDDSDHTTAGEQARYRPSDEFVARARIQSKEHYDKLYRESLEAPEAFWKREARDLVFRKPWSALSSWDHPFAKWFEGAELNASESCLDRHLSGPGRDKRAIIWESEPGETVSLTYAELHAKVVEFAAALRHAGVEKGDRVAIYMGMVPEVVVAMLACARVGAPHTVVFGGFAAESLRDRIAAQR
jgi:acetyl-CoA synthetase